MTAMIEVHYHATVVVDGYNIDQKSIVSEFQNWDPLQRRLGRLNDGLGVR
jgi:hypothetical protein